MKRTSILLLFAIALAGLCGLCTPDGAAAEPRNVLMICIDDLRPELASFGASYIHSPNIDRLAEAGRAFHHHYVNAPSCGPSRYTLLTGLYGPPGNNALFVRADKMKQHPDAVHPSMPEWFRRHGYTTVSVGKVSHHPGGRGGKNWNDDTAIEMPGAWDRHLMPTGPWQHPRGAMHGLANGEIRRNAGDMDVYQAKEGPDTIYPDGLITEEALDQLGELAADGAKPFFLAVGLIRPHLPFGAPKRYLDRYHGVELPPIPHPARPTGPTTWHRSGEFMKYNRWGRDPNEDNAFASHVRRHYAACVSYADAQVGRILDKLKQTGADRDTVVVLWGDHGWHLGEHGIWGKHSLFEEALRAPLIIRAPGLPSPGTASDAVVETVDVFPTLCELAGIDTPGFLVGTSLGSQLAEPDTPGHTAVAYRKGVQTLRTATHRLTVHSTGLVELYDHTTAEKETANVAESHPGLVDALRTRLSEKFKSNEDVGR